MMEHKTGALVHNDTDGVGCLILLKKYLNIDNYIMTSIPKFEYNLYRLKERGITDLIIADLSLDQHLIDVVNNEFENVVWIDHHESSLGHEVPFKNLINMNGSGTLLTMKWLKDVFPDIKFSREMKTLVKLINDYDLWIHNHPESNLLNNLFFSDKPSVFMDTFKNGIGTFLDNDDNYKKAVAIQEKKESEIVAMETYLVGDMRVVLADNYISDISLMFPEEHFFIIKGNGFSLRSNKAMKTLYNEYNEKGYTAGGHSNAGGGQLKGKEVVDAIEIFYNFTQEN
jgi:oligoribonuclease NrnB/cAMP/cGMP phosphodiesterase (DHH superfamily)